MHSRGVARDRNSVVKIEGLAPRCSRTIEGSGFVISPDHVVTNAHVVAGVTDELEVYTRFASGEHPARVVLFDPESDIAVLYVPGLNLPALHFAGQAPFGTSAVVAGYPLSTPRSPSARPGSRLPSTPAARTSTTTPALFATFIRSARWSSRATRAAR